MSLEYREIVRQHTQTRAAITTQTGDIGTLISNSQTAIITDNASQTTTLQTQLNAIQASVDALQQDVSSAISVPSVIERPDENTTRTVQITFYNYDDGIMANVPFGVPQLALRDGSGAFVTNGTGGTGGAVPINNINMVAGGTGVYTFDLVMNNPNPGGPNLDIGNFAIEITVQETVLPEYSIHPRSFEVVEISGVESGFSSLEAGQTAITADIASLSTELNTLIGDPTSAANFPAADITTMLDNLTQDVSDLITSVGTNKGINRSLQTVELMPFGGASPAILDADPTTIAGLTAFFPGNGNERVYSNYNILVPNSPQVSHTLVDDTVEYDLVWTSEMNTGTGTSRWHINSASITVGDPVAGRAISAQYAATDTETQHAVHGEIKDASIQDLSTGWYLILAGTPAGVNTLTLKILGETRIKFTYSTATV